MSVVCFWEVVGPVTFVHQVGNAIINEAFAARVRQLLRVIIDAWVVDEVVPMNNQLDG